MRFLTIPRTWKELHHLAEQLAQCRCAFGPFVTLHQTKEFVFMHDMFKDSSMMGTASDFSNLLDVVKGLASIVSTPITTIEQSRGKIYKTERNRRRDEKRGRSPLFPATPEDVLPFGAQISMNSLFNWYQWCSHQPHNGAAMGELIAQIILMLGDSVVPAVASSKTLLDTLHYVVPMRSERLRAVKPDILDSRDLHAASTILLALALVMPPLLLAKWSFSNNNASYTINMESALIVIAFELAGPIEAANGEIINLGLTVANFAIFHGRLIIGMRRDAELTPMFPLLYQHKIIRDWTDYCDKDVNVSSPQAEAPWKIRAFFRSRRCFAPGCVRSFHSERRKFARCGACRAVFYCSTECQRTAFCHPIAPHKRVCRYLWLIAEVDGSERNEFEYAQMESEGLGQVVSTVRDIVPLKACCMILAYDDHIQAAYAQAIGKPYFIKSYLRQI
jgi:hypothetical protein